MYLSKKSEIDRGRKLETKYVRLEEFGKKVGKPLIVGEIVFNVEVLNLGPFFPLTTSPRPLRKWVSGYMNKS